MYHGVSRILFDKQDHELLVIVNEVLNRDKSRKYLKNLLNPYLHPHGIKEIGGGEGVARCLRRNPPAPFSGGR